MTERLLCSIIIILLGLGLQLPLAAQTSARDRRLIAYARNLDVSRLDSKLPSQRFEPWLRSLIGMKAKIDWEINDCGEQTGNPADGSSINPPLCAQAQSKLSDGRSVYFLIFVGTHKAGIKGRPSIWSMSLEQDGKFTNPDKLGAMATLLRYMIIKS